MHIKVSIIIPVYNVEDYLRQCLDSVINQTLRDLEIICVNDGSTDKSLQILEEYAHKDKRIRIINQKNSGQGTARNTGMDYATGEYVGFVDSDDWIELNMFKELYQDAINHNSDMVMCPICVFSENFEDLIYDFNYFNLEYFNEDFDNSVFDYSKAIDFFFSICVTPFNKIYKNEFLTKINVKFPEGLIFEDNPFFYKTFLEAKRVSLVRKFLYHYRVNRSGSTILNFEKFFDIIDIHAFTREILSSHSSYNKLKIDSYNYIIRSILHRYFLVSEDYRAEFFELIKKDFLNFDLGKKDVNDLDFFLRINILMLLIPIHSVNLNY
jgi:Glycosyltransferases involved in cell wall biogenesis